MRKTKMMLKTIHRPSGNYPILRVGTRSGEEKMHHGVSPLRPITKWNWLS